MEKSMERKEIKISSEKDTRAFAAELAEKAGPGDVIALVGDLGTGKTTLTKYIAEALGVTDVITSPTFNIVCEYKTGRMPLYHFDVYRLTGPEEVYDLGFDEYFYGDGLCVIEWADLIEETLPEETIFIEMQYGRSPEERIYTVSRQEQ
jgi:tRNA threonylcarbamoyladenosine biosynthesis protein TsaE